MKSALIVVDVQKGFCTHGHPAAASLDKAMPFIVFAIKRFHQAGMPVIFVQDEGAGEPGNPAYELHADLDIKDGDLRLEKTRASAFCDTGLEAELKRQGIQNLIIVGYAAEECVLRTYFVAEELGFQPLLLNGGIASDNDACVKFVLDITHNCTSRVLGLYVT